MKKCFFIQCSIDFLKEKYSQDIAYNERQKLKINKYSVENMTANISYILDKLF